MKLSVQEFITYLDCPRKYLHKQLNPDKAITQAWVNRKKEAIKLAVDQKHVPNVPAEKLQSVCVSSSILSAYIQQQPYIEKEIEVGWGKHKLTYKGWFQDNVPVHLHISSTPFRNYSLLYIELMLLRQKRIILYEQLEPRIRLKKSESPDAYGKRLLDGVVVNISYITITEQEIEANKVTFLKIFNKIKRGDLASFNPLACCKTVEICPYYNICWAGKPQILGVDDE